MHWIQKPAQWLKTARAVYFHGMLAHVCTDYMTVSYSEQSRRTFDLISTILDVGFFLFVCLFGFTFSFVFYKWIVPFIIFDLFLGCILLVILQQTTSSWEKKYMFENKCRFSFSSISCSSFVLNECNCCTSHVVCFHIVLPFLTSANCVKCFVTGCVTSWSFMCGCSGYLFFKKRKKKKKTTKKMSSYLHRTIWMWRSQRPCLLWGCVDPVLW